MLLLLPPDLVKGVFEACFQADDSPFLRLRLPEECCSGIALPDGLGLGLRGAQTYGGVPHVSGLLHGAVLHAVVRRVVTIIKKTLAAIAVNIGRRWQ